MYIVYSVNICETTYYGISSEEHLNKIAYDALQECPETSVAQYIAVHIGKLKKESKRVTYAVAMRTLYALDPEATPWDVDVACTTSVTTWPDDALKKGTPAEFLRNTPWMTEHGATATMRMFFRTGCTTDMQFVTTNIDKILEGKTFVDVMCSFFDRMLVKPKTRLGYGAVYNPSNKKVVMRTTAPPWFEEVTPLKFGKMVVPWVGNILLGVCYHILAGSREEQNPRLDLDSLKKRATEILTMAYEEELVGSLLDGGNKKDLNPIASSFLNLMMDNARDPYYHTSLYQKKMIYPATHPQHPNYAKYAKTINEQALMRDRQQYDMPHFERPILDMHLLKRAERNARSELKADAEDLKELEFYT